MNNTYIYEKEEHTRLDVYISSLIPISRNILKKHILEGNILVNDEQKKPKYLLSMNDSIKVSLPEKDNEIKAIKMDLEIIYEDDDIIVINKPIGISVHPAPTEKNPTLVNGLLAYTSKLSYLSGEDRPGIVHRLDKDTSGIMLIAKSDTAHTNLQKQFKDRTITKIYIAVVDGTMNQINGTIDYPIGRHPSNRIKMYAFKNKNNEHAKNAITKYEVLGTRNNKTLLKVNLLTGRTHQIRVHLEAIGHPVMGDPLYGGKKAKKQLLHSYALTFIHPITNKELTFKTLLPSWAKPYIDLTASI